MRFGPNQRMLALLQAFALFSLVACGGETEVAVEELAVEQSAEDSLQTEETLYGKWRVRDNTAPTVSVSGVQGPSATGIAKISGTASDNLRLYRVRWFNSRGGSGTAWMRGTVLNAAWSVSNLQLQSGSNVITVVATDAAGNSASTSATLDRLPSAGPAPATTILTWGAPTSSDVAGYRVYYGTSSRNYQQALGSGVSAGNATTFTVSGLPRGSLYYFAVTSIDAAGNESSYSNEASKLVQ